MNNYSLQNYVVQLLGWTNEEADTLDGEHKKWAIILIGPPGSGKGTQAELLAEKFGLVHFETSKVIENKFNSADSGDEFLAEQKRIWEAGILNPPDFVAGLVIEKIKEMFNQGKSVVFSSSPRTLFEAEQEMPWLEKLYGKENINIINLELDEHRSIERNSARRICEKNRHPIPNFPEYEHITECPKDGSRVLTRALDKSEVIKVRYQEYLNRTNPVLNFLEQKGHKIIKINGDQFIEKVFQDILEKLRN